MVYLLCHSQVDPITVNLVHLYSNMKTSANKITSANEIISVYVNYSYANKKNYIISIHIKSNGHSVIISGLAEVSDLLWYDSYEVYTGKRFIANSAFKLK